jgi:amino acid transporter
MPPGVVVGTMFIRRWLIGIPLATVEASRERLSKVVALAVFSSDALSSVAYATEEMLLVLVMAGSLALGWSLPLSLAILLLLVILTVSYRQTIHAYPSGGAPISWPRPTSASCRG